MESEKCVESILAQANSSCAVARHSQRDAWCPGRVFSGSCSLHMKRSCLRVKWLDNHTQDHGRSQVHICRHVHETSSHTLQLQLQQQSFKTYQMTPAKCPHLSNEMTGQVDSSALDQFLSSPHVVSYPAVVSSCSTELCSVTVFALLATLSTASSSDTTPTNRRRITLQPTLSVATRRTMHMRRLAPHSTLACPKHHPSNSHQGNTLQTSLANCFTSWMFMSCSTLNSKCCCKKRN